MMKLIPSTDRYHATPTNWLSSYYLFSFADYNEPDNTNFGPLRAFNDATVQGKGGYPQQPRSEMEIVTLVLAGELVHEDTMGNHGTVTKGDAQRLTAGTGIAHAEMNATDTPTHIYQIWLMPGQAALAPSYEQKDVDLFGTSNQLVPVASGQKVLEDLLFINSNSTIYWCNLDNEETVRFKTFPIRCTFIYVMEGQVFVNGLDMGPNDQLRSTNEHVLEIQATQDARFVLIDLPSAEANY
ncbi:pirin family protein [Hymenobacter amundsenii]|uniref:Pirin family protein n=1 Tax=Hymenobacter amundsenii TaxID=2006685 RepID=A0A246FHR0_9BACT|nr:pirin family protein [Hymenobacter amundsenii]OWP62064.1 pirin family protein [Hymenobacter amundsenii]